MHVMLAKAVKNKTKVRRVLVLLVWHREKEEIAFSMIYSHLLTDLLYLSYSIPKFF